jgi:predicted metal-dependent enzyme (double-stranded beta helix superfamily)
MEDDYILDTPRIREFIAEVYTALRERPVAEALEQLRPAFADLLADPAWLPDTYMQPAPESGMGGGIATWLIYRAGDGGLSLFSLVVPPGSTTPVHDHLAWGLVGLYTGEQDERVYKRLPGAPDHLHTEAYAHLELAEQNHLRPGDFYVLMPPEGDIHSVATISNTPSVSIHLLGNDTGCTWRHAYEPDTGAVRAFKSGWSNVECKEADA